MKRAIRLCLMGCLVGGGILAVSGCGKDGNPPPPPPPPPRTDPVPDKPAPKPANPTVQISSNPSTIERGNQTTLRWSSSNASSVVIDSGVGNVAESGSIVVRPDRSTTYTATATGAGGEAKGSSRVTVIDPPAPPPVSTTYQLLSEAIRDGKIRPVFFAYDKAQLSEESKSVLRENARWIRQYPDVIIVVEGHCDERGSEEYNLALGDSRARATFDYLTQLGVDTGRIETISFGEEKPFDPGTTEAAFAKNRRAHFRPKR